MYLGTALFMCAVYYKLMALYFALPMFAYVIGILYHERFRQAHPSS